jgi:hypothetical protein
MVTEHARLLDLCPAKKLKLDFSQKLVANLKDMGASYARSEVLAA